MIKLFCVADDRIACSQAVYACIQAAALACEGVGDIDGDDIDFGALICLSFIGLVHQYMILCANVSRNWRILYYRRGRLTNVHDATLTCRFFCPARKCLSENVSNVL